jgi:hypothetical protein
MERVDLESCVRIVRQAPGRGAAARPLLACTNRLISTMCPVRGCADRPDHHHIEITQEDDRLYYFHLRAPAIHETSAIAAKPDVACTAANLIEEPESRVIPPSGRERRHDLVVGERPTDRYRHQPEREFVHGLAVHGIDSVARDHHAIVTVGRLESATRKKRY